MLVGYIFNETWVSLLSGLPLESSVELFELERWPSITLHRLHVGLWKRRNMGVTRYQFDIELETMDYCTKPNACGNMEAVKPECHSSIYKNKFLLYQTAHFCVAQLIFHLMGICITRLDRGECRQKIFPHLCRCPCGCTACSSAPREQRSPRSCPTDPRYLIN